MIVLVVYCAAAAVMACAFLAMPLVVRVLVPQAEDSDRRRFIERGRHVTGTCCAVLLGLALMILPTVNL